MESRRLVIENARILDVVSGSVEAEQNICIEGRRIVDIGSNVSLSNAQVIDVRGRYVMPGLCDAHVHAAWPVMRLTEYMKWSPYYTALRSAPMLRDMLMRGFTTVRDCGGAEFGLARAVEENLIPGPRLLYCGKALSQTGGHGDARLGSEMGEPENIWTPGLGRICDGVTEVRKAARDEIRRGAHHIKIMANGGIATYTDPVTNTQFSEEEIRAAVDEAKAAGKYVSAHCYTAEGIARALRNGVRSIEHGNFIDDETAKLLVEKNAFLVPTLIVLKVMSENGLASGMDPVIHAKIDSVWKEGAKNLEVAKRNGVKMVYATDLAGPLFKYQNEEFHVRSAVLGAAEQIRGATSYAAELFQMEGEIGVVRQNALADLLVLDGNPLEDIDHLRTPETSMRVIMKEGIVFKNTL